MPIGYICGQPVSTWASQHAYDALAARRRPISASLGVLLEIHEPPEDEQPTSAKQLARCPAGKVVKEREHPPALIPASLAALFTGFSDHYLESASCPAAQAEHIDLPFRQALADHPENPLQSLACWR